MPAGAAARREKASAWRAAASACRAASRGVQPMARRIARTMSGVRFLVDPALGELLRGLPADGRHDARGEFDRRHRQQAGGVRVQPGPGAGAPAWRCRRRGSAVAARATSRACAGERARSRSRTVTAVARRVSGWSAARRAGCKRLSSSSISAPPSSASSAAKVLEVHIERALRQAGGLHHRIHRHRRRLRRAVAGARRLQNGGAGAGALCQADFCPSLQIHSCHVRFL